MQTYFALGLQINLFFINITSFMCNYLTLIPQCRKSTTDTFLTLNVYLWIPFLITLFAGICTDKSVYPDRKHRYKTDKPDLLPSYLQYIPLQ